MTHAPDLPRIPPMELPIQELQAPLAVPEKTVAEPASFAEQPNIRGLCELLEPAISATIARKTRQRRYTP